MRDYDAFLIAGRWTRPAGEKIGEVVSPITEDVVGHLPASTTDDIDAAVVGARQAHEKGLWSHLTFVERGDYLLRMVEVLRGRLDEAVHLQIDEMGSPLEFMTAVTTSQFNLMARRVQTAIGIDRRQVRDGTVGKVLVLREPVGVAAGIIPWNAPVALALSKTAAALLAGCPVVVKPAPESPLSAYLIAEAAIEAGLPQGLLSIVPGGRQVGEYLVTHPGVDHVSFTGSTQAGTRIAALCGERLKGVTLELGGKSAAILLRDVDLEEHLPSLLESCLLNNGQVCTATTRILVPKERSKEITTRLIDAVSDMKVGNPHDSDVDFGPLVAQRQRDRVEAYIRDGREQGATVACGGERPGHLKRGWYIEPTIFTKVDNGMRIAQEEIFGPVLSIIEYQGEDEAVSIANDSRYGLGGAVFTNDVQRGLAIAERVETGTFQINSAPSSGGGGPFGGVKMSGLGRERDWEGYESYFNIKSIALPPGEVG